MLLRRNVNIDPDKYRLKSFLLGLILVLATLYVALEYPGAGSLDTPDTPADDPEEQDIDLSALMDDKDPLVLMSQESPPDAASTRIVDQTSGLDDTETEETPPLAVEESEQPEEPDPEEKQDAKEPLPFDDNPLDLRVITDLPQFPGGATAFMEWLTENLKYPASAKAKRIEGRVVASFLITTEGRVTGLHLTETLCDACDQEVIRVMRMMPLWKPGIDKGKPCRTRVVIPVYFKL